MNDETRQEKLIQAGVDYLSSAGKNTISRKASTPGIYIDNVTPSIEEFLPTDGSVITLRYYDLGFNINVSDKIIYSELQHRYGGSIVLTSDKGKDIIDSTKAYQGKVCTIIFNIKGKANQQLAAKVFFKTPNFKASNLGNFPSLYSIVRISREGRHLAIRYFDIKKNKFRCTRKNNVWAAAG